MRTRGTGCASGIQTPKKSRALTYPVGTVSLASAVLRRRTSWAVCLCLGGCTVDEPASPQLFNADAITAQVHIHQYDEGSHVTATFLREPTQLRPLFGDQVVNFAVEATVAAGPCALFRPTSCEPSCDGNREYCTRENTCAPFKALSFFDAGPVTIRGSSVAPNLDIRWSGTYYRANVPFQQAVFAGGETLQVDAATFSGSVVAPSAVTITEPSTLHLPASGPFRLSWAGARAPSVFVRLDVRSRDGAQATVACVAPDTGTMVVPSEIINALPAPPRQFNLELEPHERKFVAVRGSPYRAMLYVGRLQLRSGTD